MEPDVQTQQEQKKEKKRGGFFGWLRGSKDGSTLARGGIGTGGLGSGGAFGGLGGVLGRGALNGGLLATKAGLIGLIMIGTTVAGGVGVLGYRLFGPGADRAPGSYDLFAPRPPSQSADAAGSADGNSQSLSLFAGANTKPEEAPPAAAAASAEAPAEAKTGDAVAAKQDNKANVFGNKAATLKSDRKIGDLSKLGSLGGGGSTANASATPAASLNNARSALGTTKGSNTRSASNVGRAIARKGMAGGNAFRQLGAVRRDQAGAPSSGAAGTTYDGSRPSVAGTDAGTPGAGAGTGGAGITPNPTPAAETAPRFPPPPKAGAVNVTPWQGAINTAMMMIVGAAALLFMANKMTKTPQTKTMAIILASIASMLALGAIALGSMMAGGQYGQKFQGQMFMLSGGAMLAAAAICIMGAAGSSGTAGAGAGGGAAGGAAPGNASGAMNQMGPEMWMLLAGGAGLAAAMMGYMSKPMKYDASYFQNGMPPDWNQSSMTQRQR